MCSSFRKRFSSSYEESKEECTSLHHAFCWFLLPYLLFFVTTPFSLSMQYVSVACRNGERSWFIWTSLFILYLMTSLWLSLVTRWRTGFPTCRLSHFLPLFHDIRTEPFFRRLLSSSCLSPHFLTRSLPLIHSPTFSLSFPNWCLSTQSTQSVQNLSHSIPPVGYI